MFQSKLIVLLSGILFCFCSTVPCFANANQKTISLLDQYRHYPNHQYPALSIPLPQLSMRSIDKKGSLIFSDSPETVLEDGILYEDTVKGRCRLYYYHVNGTATPKKVVVLLQNNTNKNTDYTIIRSANAGPSKNYFYVGKTSQENYLVPQTELHQKLAAGKTTILNQSTQNKPLTKDELVCGIYDLTFNNPTKIIVAMMPVNADPVRFIRTAHILPPDSHKLRGTFPVIDRTIIPKKNYNPAQDGTVNFVLGDNILDKYLTGKDATTGEKTINYGNYGVLYYINIPMRGTGYVNYSLTPLGGVYSGCVGVRINDSDKMQLIGTPGHKMFFGKQYGDIANLGTYNMRDKVLFIFSPPGASNLPISITVGPA